MAYPQRFSFGFGQMPMQQFVTGYAPVNMAFVPPVVPVVPNYTFIQTPTIITSMGARPMKRRDPIEKPPTTTVFVGNINERVPNDVIKAMLQKCGSTGMNWRRVQGSNGKFQAFGFCEYDHPNSTFRALRLLNDWPLGDKKLVVKVDEKTKKVLNEFVNRRRQIQGKPQINVDGDLPEPDADERAEDEMFRQQISELVKEQLADLEKSAEDGEIPTPTTVFGLKRGNLEEIDELDDTKREYISREIYQFREAHKEEKPEKKRRSSSRDRSGGRERSGRDRSGRKGDTSDGKSIVIDITDDSTTPRKRRMSGGPSQQQRHSRSPSPSGDRRNNKRKRKEISPAPIKARSRSKSRNSSRRRSRSHDEEMVSDGGSVERRTKARRAQSESSEEDEETIERKRLERKIREKEVAYQERLRKWESRESKKAREFDREAKKEKAQRKAEQKEAKKLKEFLEDYEDERDDPKFYKSAALVARRREFEKEKESDMRDRKKEKEELEEIKKKLVDEGYANPDAEIERLQRLQEEKLLRRMRNSVSSSPASEVVKGNRGVSESSESDSGDEDMQSAQDSRAPSVSAQSGTPKLGPESFRPVETSGSRIIGAPVIKLGLAPPVVAPIVKKVFNVDEEDSEKKKSRPLVPLTYTDEEKQAIQSTSEPLTADQKKQAIKKLIEQIPTSKEELFAYPIEWDYVDDVLLDKRVKPWVTKKIVEYIGEEEPSLVDFICKKVMKKSTPHNLMEDVTMVLDDEAEVFVVKMWRLLIYEVEAKKQGLVKDT